MHEKIIDLINMLVKMSGEKDNIKNLNEELQNLDNLLPKLKDELETLKTSITDEKYFDASSEIIDRNIELSLKKKISNLQDILNKQKIKIETVIKKNNDITSKFDLLNKRILSCENFINILNSRFQNESEKDGDSRYFRLLEQEKARYESLNKELKEIMAQKELISSQLEELENSKQEIINNLNSEKNRLEEVSQNLSNKSTYIDNQRKEEDLNKIKELELKIENTVKRKTEIIESITFNAEQAKELLLNSEDNNTKFLAKINNITNELNNLPYQKIEDEAILREELRQLESKKDELTTLIENKKYTASDLNIIDSRLEYLESKTKLINKEIETYKSIENIIDNEEIGKLTDILVELREQVKSYEMIFTEYDLVNNVDSDHDFEIEKYNLLNEIVTNYENDLQDLISISNNINVQNIINCEKQLDNIKEEKEYLNKKKLLHSDSINLVEKEKDRKELKDLVDNIEKLYIRLDVGITPNQVLDQIEMLLFAEKESHEEDNVVSETIVPESEEPIIEQEIQQLKNEPEFTFEKLPDELSSGLDENIYEEEIINPEEQNVEIFSEPNSEEYQNFSFSPLDNTGFMSFEDAINIAKNE